MLAQCCFVHCVTVETLLLPYMFQCWHTGAWYGVPTLTHCCFVQSHFHLNIDTLLPGIVSPVWHTVAWSSVPMVTHCCWKTRDVPTLFIYSCRRLGSKSRFSLHCLYLLILCLMKGTSKFSQNFTKSEMKIRQSCSQGKTISAVKKFCQPAS